MERDIIVDSILDWKDSDNFHRVNGAEDDYYESLPTPRTCKDAHFDTVEELLLVRGITPLLFYGSYVPEEESGEKPAWRKGLADLFTVYTRSYRLDANSAAKEALMGIPGMSETVAGDIITAREDEPIKDINALRMLLGGQTQMFLRYLAVTPSISGTYTIISTGFTEESGVKRRIKGVVKIHSRSEEKVQICYWVDNYQIAENLFPLFDLWEQEEQETL